jgi:CRISPR/Cas system CSM-associated protein Csm2 small subunit
MSGDDKVGYKRPPKATRWKKGHSGNPRGRPKHARNLKTELTEELGETIRIREQGGAWKRVSKLRAMLKAQLAKAVGGDTRAADVIFKAMRVLDPEAETPESTPLNDDDARIIEDFLKRQLKRGGIP